MPLSESNIDGGYSRNDAVVDHDQGTVMCPNGIPVTVTAKGNEAIEQRCFGCPVRDRCTTARNGRTLKTSDHGNELVAARRAWNDKAFMEDHRQYRSMVEGAIAWIVTNGHRWVQYRSVESNRAQLALRVTAINLRRLFNLDLNHNKYSWAIG